MLARVWRTAARLHAEGVRRGDRVGVRMPSGRSRAVHRDPRHHGGRCRIRPGRRRRPRRARRPRIRRGRGARRRSRRRASTDRTTVTAATPSTAERSVRRRRAAPEHERHADRRAPDDRGRCVDHLHLGLDRRAEGRGGVASLRGGVRGRRSEDVPPGLPARSGRPGARRPVRRVRRIVRGDVARLAVRRVPGAGAHGRSSAPARTSGPWLVGHSITVVSTVPTLAALWPQDAVENVRLLIFGGEACPPELVARLVGEGRELWNTYGPPRRPLWHARR